MRKIIMFFAILLISIPVYAGWQDINPVQPYNYKTISTQTTTVVKTGNGILHNIIVTGGTAGTITVYDNTSAVAPIIASFSSTNALSVYPFDVAFASGCTVVTGASTAITVSYL